MTDHLLGYAVRGNDILCICCFNAQERTHGIEVRPGDAGSDGDCDICGLPLSGESDEHADAAVYARAHSAGAA